MGKDIRGAVEKKKKRKTDLLEEMLCSVLEVSRRDWQAASSGGAQLNWLVPPRGIYCSTGACTKACPLRVCRRAVLPLSRPVVLYV